MADFMKRYFGNNLTLARDAAARGSFAPDVSESVNTSAFHHDTAYQAPNPSIPATINPENPSFDSNTPSDKAGPKDADYAPRYTPVGAHDSGYQGPQPNERVDLFGRRMRDWWVREILSLLCSLGSLIAIVIVLAKHDKIPSHSLAAGVSLNTYLAVFATLAKAGLMYPVMSCIGQLKWIWFSKNDAPLADFARFDDATRGPWDALMLLGSLNFWHSASIGALITILSIGISPITQQTIAYSNELVPSTLESSALAPSANLWNGIGIQTTHTDVSSAPLSLPIQAAINSAIYNAANVSIPSVAPTCATGNCTWPAYDSLAICTKVSNVTDMLTVPPLGKEGPTLTNVTLPNKAYLEYGIYTSNITSKASVPLLTDNSTIGLMVSSAYIIYEEHGLGLMEITTTKQPVFNALELVFYWCVNTYETRVINGTASTQTIASSSNVTMDRMSDDKSEFNIYGNATIAAPKGTAGVTAVFNVTQQANLVLGTYLSGFFNGNYFGGAPNYIAAAQNPVVAILQPLITANTTTLVQEGILNYTSNMANSMTNTIRTYMDSGVAPDTVYVAGTSYSVRIFVHIKWAWLSLLLGLVGASILFLLMTIIHTAISRVEVMKSHPLAAVTILSPEAQTYMGPTALNTGTVNRAEVLRVRLGKGAGGWSLDPVR